MLTTAFIYAIKSALILSILYLVYRVVFKKNTHYHLKRVSMLVILSTSLILPTLEVNTKITSAPAQPVFNQINTVLSTKKAQEVAYTRSSDTPNVESPLHTAFDWSAVITYLYWAGVCVSLLVFFRQLTSVLYLIVTGKARHDLGRKLISHEQIKYPFSFWKWTFLPANSDIKGQTWDIVNEHELTHLRQAHSADLLFASLANCFLWFTPAAHYLQKNIRDNHEFLADQEVLKTYNVMAYSEALLGISLQTNSLELTHSFALKSNLSKRINQMSTQKTSIWRSSIAICILLSSTLLITTQVSLFGQDNEDLKLKEQRLNTMMGGLVAPGFSTLHIYEQTGQFPDAWASFMVKGISPIMLLEKHEAILEAFKKSSETSIEGQSDRVYHVSLRKSKAPEFYDRGAYELKKNKFKTELIQELSTKEKIEMYALAKAWSDKYILQVYPDFELISELDFMEKSYLVFQSQPDPTDPRKYSVKTVFKSDEVDLLPNPIGGLDRYLNNVTKYCEKDPTLDSSDLPKKIEFEFTIDPGGNMVMVSLKSKVRGPEATQDKVYDLLKQINDNLIKVSDVYGWKPGEKEGTTVATKMRLTIPKELL